MSIDEAAKRFYESKEPEKKDVPEKQENNATPAETEETAEAAETAETEKTETTEAPKQAEEPVRPQGGFIDFDFDGLSEEKLRQVEDIPAWKRRR